MSDLSGATIRQLEYLLEASRQTSFGAAADQLQVSQSAVSQGLAKLAGQLSVELFEPDGRNRRLTNAGRDVVTVVERVLAQLSQLERYLADRRAGTTGRLRVGMIDAAALYLMPNAVRQLQERDIELEVVVGASRELADRLLGFELDVAFLVGPQRDLATEAIFREDLYVFGPSPVAGVSASATADEQPGLATTDWVLYPTGSRTRARIDEAFARAGVQPQVTAESANPAILRQLVTLGMGSTVIPETVAAQETGFERATTPLIDRTIVAAMRPVTSGDPLVREVIDLAHASAAG